MRLVRFAQGGKEGFGVIEGDLIVEASGSMFDGFEVTGRHYPLAEIKLLPPVKPTKIVAVGLNYKDHADELKIDPPQEPLLFLKPPSAIIGHYGCIVYPSISNRVDYEGELAVIIGKIAKCVAEERWTEFIFGYTCFNDVTARDLQSKDGQWTRAKGFDTFAPLGPWIETQLDPTSLILETYLNGECRQRSNTANMIFPLSRLVSFISQIMTLYPGDVIATGTPAGIGPLHVGDTVEVRIEGIGGLVNIVSAPDDDRNTCA